MVMDIMKTVKAVLNLEQAAQAITLIGKKITKLKVIGFGFIGAAGALIGIALNKFEEAGQLEAVGFAILQRDFSGRCLDARRVRHDRLRIILAIIQLEGERAFVFVALHSLENGNLHFRLAVGQLGEVNLGFYFTIL